MKSILTKLNTTPSGLSSAEADLRLQQNGPNAIPSQSLAPSILDTIVEQFKSPLIFILLIAVTVTAYLHHWVDTVVIGVTIAVNTIVGFLQEFRAQKAIEALRAVVAPHALVLRDGKEVTVLATEVVVGDVVLLRAGFGIPADGVMLESSNLLVDEASLTGESVPVEKIVMKEYVVEDDADKVFWGTNVVGGVGKMVVISVGLQTRFGKIAGKLREMREGKTPLQKRLAEFSKVISIWVGVLCLILFTFGVLTGKGVEEMFIIAVALAVSAIPESLVVVLTVILAVGMQRIFKRKALVRKLVSAETLGSTSVICTDKTGTLTEGKMRVVGWEVTDGSLAVKTAVLCNNLIGPTEVALWDKVKTIDSIDPQKLVDSSKRLDTVPFSSERKYMLTLNSVSNGKKGDSTYVFAKGASEKLIKWCKLSLEEKNKWTNLEQEWGREGLRVLALAYKEVHDQEGWKELSGFTFLGLVAFSDPLRSGVQQALKKCQEAGISVKVITGDYRVTAESIMRKLGFDLQPDEIMEGYMLHEMDEVELAKRVGKIKLFARTSPTDKLRIVEVLQSNGEVVAMTGDGINDAPALKRADIGIVVGEATEVAKEIADMVLIDSNFETIVAAVEEGRGIFETLRTVVLYLMSDSFTEVILIGGALILGLPLPITAAQILWINLIGDGLPDFALIFEPRSNFLMQEPPRKLDTPILDTQMKVLIFGIGILTDLVLFSIAWYLETHGYEIRFVRTIIFAALATDSLFYVFACRSLRYSIFQKSLFSNKLLLGAVFLGFMFLLVAVYHPFFQMFLNTVSLSLNTWVLLIVLGIFELFVIELVKHYFVVKRYAS